MIDLLWLHHNSTSFIFKVSIGKEHKSNSVRLHSCLVGFRNTNSVLYIDSIMCVNESRFPEAHEHFPSYCGSSSLRSRYSSVNIRVSYKSSCMSRTVGTTTKIRGNRTETEKQKGSWSKVYYIFYLGAIPYTSSNVHPDPCFLCESFNNRLPKLMWEFVFMRLS